MTGDDLLFFRKDLSALIRGHESALKEEVAGWEPNRVLASSESDLVSYLVEKYMLDAPRILGDQLYIEREGEPSFVAVRSNCEVSRFAVLNRMTPRCRADPFQRSFAFPANGLTLFLDSRLFPCYT